MLRLKETRSEVVFFHAFIHCWLCMCVNNSRYIYQACLHTFISRIRICRHRPGAKPTILRCCANVTGSLTVSPDVAFASCTKASHAQICRTECSCLYSMLKRCTDKHIHTPTRESLWLAIKVAVLAQVPVTNLTFRCSNGRF